jgi:hypothetical protein
MSTRRQFLPLNAQAHSEPPRRALSRSADPQAGGGQVERQVRFSYRLPRLNSPKGTRQLVIPSVHFGLGQRVEVTEAKVVLCARK